MKGDLPRDPAIEKAVLSACFLDAANYPRFRSRIVPSLFTSDRLKAVAAAMDALHRQGIQPTMQTVIAQIDRDDTVSEAFRGNGEGVELLADLTVAGSPSGAIESYLLLAEEWAAKRIVLRASEEVAAMARNGYTGSDLARAFHLHAQSMESILTRTQTLRSVDFSDVMATELEPVPWIANGWIGEGDFVIFGGEPGAGKSLIALDLAISVAAGLPWMGRVPIDKFGPVIYVDEEGNVRNTRRRIKRMCSGRNMDPAFSSTIPVRYLARNRIKIDRPHGREALRSEIAKHRPVLVIMDSLIDFHSGEENSNTELAQVFGECILPLATEYGCAFLVLDHMRKAGEHDDKFDPADRIRGGGHKRAAVDGLWVVGGESDDNERTFQCRKNRWEDSLPAPLTTKWVVSEDEDAAWIECSDATLTAEAAVTLWLSESRGGLLFADLVDRASSKGITKRTLQRVLKRLTVASQVEMKREAGNRRRYWVGVLEPSAI